MRISEIEFVGLRSPLPVPAVFSWGTAHERNVGLVRVGMDDGTSGWGETSVTFPLWSLEERSVTVRNLADLFVGLPLNDADDIHAAVTSARSKTDRLRLLWSHVALSSAIGAIEMGMWDALGKALDTPVWRLLGGADLTVPLYAVGFGGPPAEAAAAAAAAIDEGYSTVKVRVGFGAENDEVLVAAVTDRIGGGVLVDANMGWTRPQAMDMIRRLDPYGLGWIEEPLSRDDLDGYRILRASTTTPIAAGENCYSEEEITALAGSGLVDVVMPDLARVGGLSAAIAGALVARDAGRGYSTHHYASDIGFAAMLTLCAVVGTPRPLLRDISPWSLRGDLLSEKLAVIGGVARPYAGPGLSPTPRETIIEEHRVL